MHKSTHHPDILLNCLHTIHILYHIVHMLYCTFLFRCTAHSKANPSDRSEHSLTVPSGRRVQQYRAKSHWRPPCNPLWSAHGGGVHACVTAGGGGAVCSAGGTVRHCSVGGQCGQHQEERGAVVEERSKLAECSWNVNICGWG